MLDSPTIQMPHRDPTTSWLLIEDQEDRTIESDVQSATSSIEQQLRSPGAEVFGLEHGDGGSNHLFLDLDGNDGAANGLKLMTQDITPCRMLGDAESPAKLFSGQLVSVESVEAVMISPVEIHNASRLSVQLEPTTRHSRQASNVSISSDNRPANEVERVIGLQKEVQVVATVRPTAGLFDEKLVIFLTLLSFGSFLPDPPSQVNLIPQSKMIFAGRQVCAIRHAVAHDIPADAPPQVWVVLDRMPLTDEGQIDRRGLRTWAQNVNDDTYHRVMAMEDRESLQAPVNDLERSLQRLCSKVLAVPHDQIGVNFSFSQLGGGEAAAMDLVARCKEESIDVTVYEVMGSQPLSEVAQIAATRVSLAYKQKSDTSEPFDLSPMQHLYLSSAMGGDDARRAEPGGGYRFNQSLLMRLNKEMRLEEICTAVEIVVGRHPMLRARFSRGPRGWTQRILPQSTDAIALKHHHISSDLELETAIESTQSGIDIEDGPVFAVDCFSTHDQQQLIYLAAHHLVVDLPSWRLIIHDLDELLQRGNLLSQRSMSFSKWIALQKAAVENCDPSTILPLDTAPVDYSYWGMNDQLNTYGDVAEISFALSAELTSILQTTCNQVFKTESTDIYLSAILLSFAQTFHDRPVPVVWNQEPGRDVSHLGVDADVSDTVGWFTSLCPVALQLQGSDDFMDVLRRLKDSRRSTRGTQYFASKFYGAGKADPLARDWPLEIIFSYAGSLQQLERENGVGMLEQLAIPGRTLAHRTSDIGGDVKRISLFEIGVVLDSGISKVKFLFSRNTRDTDARIARWAQNLEHLLLEAIGRLRYHPQELTLADVPLLDVSYRGLEQFHKQRLPALNMTNVQDVETIFPATAVQQNILISQSQRPETCYVHAIYEFASPSGEPIDTTRICAAWQDVVSRHTALRTVFTETVTEGGLFDQIILRRTSPEMLFIDTAPFEDPIEELSNLPCIRATHSKPPHRLTVCKAPTRTLVKLDISTAVCDSTSIHLLLADLRRAYVTRKPIPETVRFRYSDHLEFLKAARQERSLDFWKERLRGVQPCKFPILTINHTVQKFASVSLELNTSFQALNSFATAHATTVDSVLRLAWGLVLRLFTGSQHVCFGYQAVGRDESIEDIKTAVGSFANLVACAYDLPSAESMLGTLTTVAEQYESSLEHQNFTVPEIHHAIGLKGGERLFNSSLTFTEEPVGLKSRFATRSSSDLKVISLRQTFDLDIAMNTRFLDGKLIADMGHRILSPQQALSVANTFGKAVEAIVRSHHSVLAHLDLFSDRDYAQITSWNNDVRASRSSMATIHSKMVVHDLISSRVSETPSAEAVSAWDGSLTYEEMDAEATKLAHYLVDSGICHHDMVPVIIEKSRWAPVAMLAVLKSGAAFVPIDSEEIGLLQPIFDHLNSKVAIASGQSALILGNLFDKVIILSDELMDKLPEPNPQFFSMSDPDDAACVLFTQTTATQVRGITFTHAALSTAFIGQGPAARITASSRVMQLSSFNVDVALSEIFTTLAHGGCVCIPSSEERLQDFTGAVERMEVNWTYMTPLLSRKLDPTRLPTLKVVCFRTRTLDDDTYNPWHGKVNVLLAYGSQDVCPLAISFLEVMGTYHLKHIGQPFSGSMWIVNPEGHRKLMPVGAIGELVIGGPTLGVEISTASSRKSALSLEIAGGRKSRYFKTGHRVRYTQFGLIEFVSSKREQLEIDGKVVNFPDIEQHMRRCLGQGVDVMIEALAFRGARGLTSPILTAFVELGENLFDGEETLTELSDTTKERVYIARQLVETGMRNVVPSYMIPSIFIPVKHLPITPSLKVNRSRLQALIKGLTRDQLRELAVVPNPSNVNSLGLKPLPLTQNEDRMRAIWAKVLGIEEGSIGAADTFFRMGGDDILATKLLAACRMEGIALSINDILRNATLTELGRSMVMSEETTVEPPREESDAAVTPEKSEPSPQAQAESEREEFIQNVISTKLALNRSAIEDVAEATATQIRYIESGMLRGRANIDYFLFSFVGYVNPKKLEDACHALVKIHPILRTAFLPYNRRVYQAVLKADAVEFKRSTCPSWRMTSLVEKMLKKDQSSPIAFSAPMTTFIFVDSSKQSTLIMRLSKAQYDDLSIALFCKDLKRLYEGGETIPHRPGYGEFVRSAQLAATQYTEEHWKMLLAGATITQVVAHGKPYQISTRVQSVRQSIPIGSLANLGITFETVLKAGWAMVLASLSGTSDIVFGELIDGRHIRLQGGLSVAGVMGPTVNAIPVRVTFPETPTSSFDLLRYVHAQRVASVPYENMGFLNIVERCTPWPYWSRFSTVVQHRYEDTAISPSEPKNFHVGSAACKFTITESKAHDVSDLLVQSVVRGNTRVDLSITFDADRVPETFTNQALRMLCESINMLTGVSIMQPLIPVASQYRALPKMVPLPLAQSLADLPAQPGIPSSIAELAATLPEEQTRAIQSAISGAWAAVLNPRVLGVPEDQLHNAAFYDLWGSLIPAAQLAGHLNREIPRLKLTNLDGNVTFTMEDVIEHPTMMKQFELILGKMKPMETPSGIKEKPKEKQAVERPASPALRRKPSVTKLSASTSSALKGIRRLANTVTRSSPVLRSSRTPEPPVTPSLGTPTAPAELVTPDTPDGAQLSSLGSSSVAPQLPSLPFFTPISDEPLAMARHPSQNSDSSNGNASSVDSMTIGSSASSNGDDSERAGRGGLGDLANLQVRTPTAPTGVSLSPPPPLRADDEVSPLSAISPGTRFFDGQSSPTPDGGPTGRVSPMRKRRNMTGLVTLSPVVESVVMETESSP